MDEASATPYTVAEVKQLTGLSERTVTEMFENEPGVIIYEVKRPPTRFCRCGRHLDHIEPRQSEPCGVRARIAEGCEGGLCFHDGPYFSIWHGVHAVHGVQHFFFYYLS